MVGTKILKDQYFKPIIFNSNLEIFLVDFIRNGKLLKMTENFNKS